MPATLVASPGDVGRDPRRLGSARSPWASRHRRLRRGDRKLLAAIAALTLAVALTGCPTTPTTPPLESYLRVGAAPGEEVPAVVASLSRAGFALRRRIDGDRFTALSFARDDDGRTWVRLVTARGVVLSIAGGPLERFSEVAWADPPRRGHNDWDDDGIDDMVLRWRAPGRPAPCLETLRVRSSGAVERLGWPLLGQRLGACVESFAELGGVSGPEAMVVFRLVDAPGDAVPTVVAAHRPRSGRLWPVHPDRYRAWYDGEQSSRRDCIARARGDRNVALAHRCAVEIALLANLRGADVAEQVAIFDGALRGLVLRPDEATLVARTRAYVLAGFRLPIGEADADAAPGEDSSAH